MPLPTGTITFLFTDIEGSTQLWEKFPEAMKAALMRHHELMRHAIEMYQGHVFQIIGDAFCTAFDTAPEAVTAALAAQRALHAERWEGIPGLRVRMGLHTGYAEPWGNDYASGPTLNRTQRIMSVAYGGQVLLSMSTQQLAQDQLPIGVELRDLGQHRLKDLQRPERIFQLVSPDLPVEFPPLRGLDYRPNNLPAQATSFIGREQVVRDAREKLLTPAVRLLTLTGPGGTGKTRLSLQVAAEVLDDFSEGVFFVPLALIRDPALVIVAIAAALNVREVEGKALEVSVKEFLRSKRLLLVLDNFEQVTGAAPLVAELLIAAPQLKLLVTSRAVLRVYGEHDFPVPPLALPDPHHLPTLEHLTQYEAVRLFIERARAIKSDFSVNNDNAPAVAEICSRLDGLPLAIELAAVRARMLTPQGILSRLERRLPLLTGGGRDLPARQQTLRGAIRWSYDLLDEGEQTLFRRLAVFANGGSLEAIETICKTLGDSLWSVLPIDSLDGLGSLTDKSLIRQEESPDGPRFSLLETIREFALEQLEKTTEAEALNNQHAAFYLALAETAQKARGIDETAAMERLTLEYGNLRGALAWAFEREAVEMGARLCLALSGFWGSHGHVQEGSHWLTLALNKGEALPTATRARIYGSAGWLAQRRGDYARAQECFEAGLTLQRSQNDHTGIASSLTSLAWLALYQGEATRAVSLGEESLALYRQQQRPSGIAWALNTLGLAVQLQNNHDRARSLHEEALALSKQIDDRSGIAHALANLAYVELWQGHAPRAHTLFTEALARHHQLGDKLRVMYDLTGLAGATSDPERAARLIGAAEALRAAMDIPLSPAHRQTHERVLAMIQAGVDEAAFIAARAEGQALSLERALEMALEGK